MQPKRGRRPGKARQQLVALACLAARTARAAEPPLFEFLTRNRLTVMETLTVVTTQLDQLVRNFLGFDTFGHNPQPHRNH